LSVAAAPQFSLTGRVQLQPMNRVVRIARARDAVGDRSEAFAAAGDADEIRDTGADTVNEVVALLGQCRLVVASLMWCAIADARRNLVISAFARAAASAAPQAARISS
jgi:hypothetical protein